MPAHSRTAPAGRGHHNWSQDTSIPRHRLVADDYHLASATPAVNSERVHVVGHRLLGHDLKHYCMRRESEKEVHNSKAPETAINQTATFKVQTGGYYCCAPH